MHIEFVGPPGSGKTTIHRKISETEIYYAGLEENAIARKVHSNFDKHTTFDRFSERLVSTGIHMFDKHNIIESKIRYDAYEEFLKSNPKYSTLTGEVLKNIQAEKSSICIMLKHNAEKYQVGNDTRKNDEILILDEGFIQGLVSIRWRLADDRHIDGYYDITPRPDLLIHVDAPSELCIDRQKERERVAIDKPWTTGNRIEVQNRLKNICRLVKDELANDIPVITINTTHSIESSYDYLLNKLNDLT